ncbi:MAG: general secretion pathway protein GspM [Methylobacter sp.]|nr:MAG: general secretion pathway protein GspM [Methylobacter sp.]
MLPRQRGFHPHSRNRRTQVTKAKTKQMQRWLAVGLLVAVILMVGLVVIMPVVNKGLELHDAKNNLVFRLEQYERILARKDAVTESMDAIKEQYQERGLLNMQGTGALASAEVQEFIKKAIVEAGGQLSSTQALPVTTKNEFSRITVSVRMTGNSEVLRAVLYKIETSSPLIIVNQIDIRPMRGIRSRVTRQIEPSNELNINFQAVSFMRKQAE